MSFNFCHLGFDKKKKKTSGIKVFIGYYKLNVGKESFLGQM